MTSSKQTENQLSAWQFADRKRWRITAILKTKTPLHIGSGEPFTVEVIDSQGKPKQVEANGFIKDRGTGQGAKPIIPGSTLKGKLRSYLAGSVDGELWETVFGKGYASEEDQGNGGVAEFHDASLCTECQGGNNYPQWDQDRQTYIEASTAIDRHTGTALDASLHYTECVAPGTCFKVIVTGDMRDREAALVIKALEIFLDDGNSLFLGAETANGNGRMVLAEEGITVEQLDQGGIITWLAADSTGNLAGNCLRTLDPKEITSLTATLPSLSRNTASLSFDIITLQFKGPFLINDPARMKGTDREIHHQPLIDQDNKPIFPAKSFRGAFRSQAERIIRTMGGHCCDSRDPCQEEDVKNLCLACKMFGATGWKTTLHVEQFQYVGSLKEETQQFVAIDRFHGGGKDGALFSASCFECPEFSGKISLDIRKEDPGELAWRKGLLALLFRDLQEGDISFGFGLNKDYGTVKKVEIKNLEKITDQDIEEFRRRCRESSAEHSCAAIPVPEQINRHELPPINPATGGDNLFHNPYHFIPVKKPDVSTWWEKNELAEKTSPHSHAFYRDQTDEGQKLYHGRITCRLTAETPFFVGRGDAPEDQQGDESRARLKEHYRLNGELAIPATSLRGMISSLAEAASNSAMRVLDNGLLSCRKPADQALKTIGLLYTKKDGGWHLVPLSEKIKLKNVYGQNQNPDMNAFIEECHSWSPDHNVVYYLSGTNPDEIPVKNYTSGKKCGILRILGAKGREKSLENKKHELFLEVDREYVDTNRNRFDYAAFIKDHDHAALKVSKEAVERYQQLADQRSKSQKSNKELKEDKDCASPQWLPFHLKGGKRKRKDEYCVLPLAKYDLVYYSAEGDTVTEIAFSAIWRDKLQHSVNNFLPSGELQPFNRARTRISPAELLFGFVELNEDENKRDHSLAYAGKVKISAGRLSAGYQGMDDSELQDDEIITLKALSSPKLPSPALYFKKRNSEQAYTAKTDLNAHTEEIQGRKIYLHALRRNDNPGKVMKISPTGLARNSGPRNWPWISQNHEPDREKLKVRIRPIKENTSFDFSINFNNLTEWELGLLCYVLRPDETFRHKLGMGKPIGLGTVRIDILSVQTIDRNKRYGFDAITEQRYNGGTWLAVAPDLPVKDNGGQQATALSPERLRKIFTETMEPDIERAIQLLGNPRNIKHPVHYPQVRDTDIETENFKWFVANDFGSGKNANKLDAERKPLIPVSQRPETIPTLNRYRWNG